MFQKTDHVVGLGGNLLVLKVKEHIKGVYEGLCCGPFHLSFLCVLLRTAFFTEAAVMAQR